MLILAGCAQDNTVQVNVYANDESGRPVDGAYVSAYSSYNLGSGASNKWTSVNGTLTSTATTKNGGSATFQIIPGQYAFTASTNDGANGGAEKLIIQKNDYVYITIRKPQPTTGKFSITVVDEAGNDFFGDNTNNTKFVNWSVCWTTNEGGSGCYADESFGNPIAKDNVAPKDYVGTFKSEGYEDATLNFTLKPGDDLSFTVTLKKKLKTGSVSLSLVDDATGKLIDVSSQAITMTLTFCPAEKVPDSMFGSPWSKAGNCWTTANSNEEFRVDTNPLSAPLPIGDWNFTFWGSGAGYNSNAAVFTLKENYIVDQNVFFKKRGSAIRAQSVKEYSKANPLDIVKASPSPSASPSAS